VRLAESFSPARFPKLNFLEISMSSKTAWDRASLCSFLFADGRQCRMLKKNKSSEFCYFHQQYADQIDDAIEAGK
jgi:hypothetical protein